MNILITKSRDFNSAVERLKGRTVITFTYLYLICRANASSNVNKFGHTQAPAYPDNL